MGCSFFLQVTLIKPHPVIRTGSQEVSSSLYLLPVYAGNCHCVPSEGSQAEGMGEEREKSLTQGMDKS